MYCRTQKTGYEGFEDLALAEKMILQRVSEEADENSAVATSSEPTPLLHLEYKSLTPRSDYRDGTEREGHVFVNPPTVGNDLDEAYYEAKRLFTKLYGDADFLLREETDNPDVDDE
jgi:hypothetical protein